MTATITTALITPDELLQMPDEDAYELIDGNLVERNMGAESAEIAAQIIYLIKAFLRLHRFGRVFSSETGFQCFPKSPGKIRRADVSFIKSDRLSGPAPKGYFKIQPDLAVEVISPRDKADELDQKIAEYLDAGYPLIWVVSPPTRTVRIYRPRTAASGPISILSENETITGEDVLPGFSCQVKEFFA